MRFARFSKDLTKAAKFKDRRSKIGIRFDGTQLIRLAGKDMENLHAVVFDRDRFRCVDQGLRFDCEGPLELSHNVSRGRGGSDTPENTNPRCRKHHIYKDMHGEPGYY